MTRSKNRAMVSVACAVMVGTVVGADTNTLQVDWESRTAACPPKVTQSMQYTVAVTGINDVVIDFVTGQRVQIQFRAVGTPVSVTPPENPFINQSAPPTCPVTTEQLQTNLKNIKAYVASNANLKPGAGVSVALSASLSAANNSPDVGAVKNVLGNATCAGIVNANDPVIEWVKRLTETTR